ncbi:MAG: DUF763 domain-containing protein [Candidatus Bathyarchaeia archaeon]
MVLRKTGYAELRLHGGYAPYWLVKRMIKLSKAIFKIIIDEYGVKEVLSRLSNPFFFQACSNILGFDWDSSGSTTVTCAVLKKTFSDLNTGIESAGGKGEYSRKTLNEIEAIGKKFDLSEEEVKSLKYASRMTAKVDNAAIQAGYRIYHHMIFISESGDWAVVQQGMNPSYSLARRYHWLSEGIKSFVVEPHKAIVCEKIHERVLNMVDVKGEECRKTCKDLASENPKKLKRLFSLIKEKEQTFLENWIDEDFNLKTKNFFEYSVIPSRINWEALEKAYEIQPRNFEELLAIDGIGPATVRGLALISDLIFGQSPSWKDPAKFSFAFGGKDGVPFPIDKKSMDNSIEILLSAIYESKIGKKEKLNAIKRLKTLLPNSKLG